jgi:DNA end-binding protein Ku
VTFQASEAVLAPRLEVASMALRSMWKGSLRFSLVTIPVEAFTASKPGEGEIRLHQLHEPCHSRIKYQKTCPIHGEVRNDEIVTGFEYEKDHYVVIDRDEVEKVQADEHSIAIDTFVKPDEIDPLYYDGRTYYLAPQSAAAKRPYAVLFQAMEDVNRYGVAKVVLRGKEEILLVRPLDGVLTMTMLHYDSQIRGPEVVRDEVPQEKANAQELKLARQLIEASTTKKFDFAAYEDRYNDRLKEMIDAKIAGKEVIAPPQTDEEVPVINLMDALRKSVRQTGQNGKAKTARKALHSRLSRSGGSKREVGQHQRRRKTS